MGGTSPLPVTPLVPLRRTDVTDLADAILRVGAVARDVASSIPQDCGTLPGEYLLGAERESV
jgi:hypothetical protein